MPFGVVSGVGRGMGLLDWVVVGEGEGADLGVNVGRPIVTNGDFVAQLCESDALFLNYFGEDLLTQLNSTQPDITDAGVKHLYIRINVSNIFKT